MSQPPVSPRPFFLGLLRRRMLILPTWRAWMVMLVVAGLAGTLVVRCAYGFLALTEVVPGGVLVVEGWAPDYVLEPAEGEFRRGGYVLWCVTGAPVEKGAVLTEYGDYAALTVAAFEKAGGEKGLLQPVPWPTVQRDRTYASALALKAWLIEHGGPVDRVTVVTTGVHARRSRLLYAKAFGPGSRVGVLSVPEYSFDAERWWTSSAGVRSVVDEYVAYAYARCLFRGR